MRRGLISWSRDEVPASALDARVARLQEAMRAEALDVALAHTCFARPAAVSWLTHFVPYWSEALLAVFPNGAPVLLVALTKRVHPWIREVSHLGEILGAPNLGLAAATFLKERLPGPGKSAPRIGVIELDAFPWSVAEPVVKAGFGAALVDATALFARIRQPADAAETGLAQRASDIAVKAFAAAPANARRASEVLAAMEGVARLDGAEEVIMRVAPNLAGDAILRRIEGDAPLGERYAVELSVAYKATWVRVTRCLSAHAPPDSWREAQRWFAEEAPRWNPAAAGAGDMAAPMRAPPGKIASWTLEACMGGHPLSVVSGKGQTPPRPLPAGALAVLSLQLDFPDGPWLGAAPLVTLDADQ